MRRKPTASELRRHAVENLIDDAPNPRLGPTLPVTGPAPALTHVPSSNSTRGREEGSSVKDKAARAADEPRAPFVNEVIEANAAEELLTPDPDAKPKRRKKTDADEADSE